MQKQLPTSEEIIARIAEIYDINLISFEIIPLGADLESIIYIGKSTSQEYFVKLKHSGSNEIGTDVVCLLQQLGIKQIIPPILPLTNEPTTQIRNSILIVYPFVEGLDGFSQSLSDSQWVELGEVPRKVHAVNIPSTLTQRIPKEAFSSQWRDSLTRTYALLTSDLKSKDEFSIKLNKFLREKQALVMLMVERADALAVLLKKESHEFVLCHSDIHAGNVFISNVGSIYLVDWDTPILAPKERDLMFIGGGVANIWNRQEEVKLFYQGYGDVDVNHHLLAYYRYERIIEDLAIYCNEIFEKTAETSERSQIFSWLTDMFVPNGVVDIAFKT